MTDNDLGRPGSARRTPRVALMTLHSVGDYGTALQALATQGLIEKAGARCSVVDFRREGAGDGAQAQAGIGEELSDGDHVGHPSTPPGSSACANGCSGPRGGAAGVSAALAAAPEVHVAHQRAPT